MNEFDQCEEWLRILHDDNNIRFSSNTNDILEHVAFQNLLNKGEKLLPYLFNHALQNGVDWAIIMLIIRLGKVKIPLEHAGIFILLWTDCLNWFVTSDYYYNSINRHKEY